jgi:hypothetical protein
MFTNFPHPIVHVVLPFCKDGEALILKSIIINLLQDAYDFWFCDGFCNLISQVIFHHMCGMDTCMDHKDLQEIL